MRTSAAVATWTMLTVTSMQKRSWKPPNVSGTHGKPPPDLRGEYFTKASTTPLTSLRACRVAPSTAPVLFQAGDSPDGRDFAARQADVIFSAHPKFDDAVEFRRDIVTRSIAAGRGANAVQIMPASEFILGATDQEAQDKKAWSGACRSARSRPLLIWNSSGGAANSRPTIPMALFRRSIPWWRKLPKPAAVASMVPSPPAC